MKSTEIKSKIIQQVEKLNTSESQEVYVFLKNYMESKEQKTHKIKTQFGLLKGKVHIASDFDEPLEDFKEYM